MPPVLEQGIGAAVMLLALVDMFATVLYARINRGPASKLLSWSIWWVFHRVGGWFPQRLQDLIFSFCGPIVLSSMVLAWAVLLTVGSALIIHPALGTGVAASNGLTPTSSQPPSTWAAAASPWSRQANSPPKPTRSGCCFC
jgi:hypothetical protein